MTAALEVVDYRRDHLAAAVRERLARLDPMRAEAARAMPEDKVLLPRVIGLCRQTGQKAWYHTHRSDRSEAGYPDLHIVGAGGSLFRELKRETGKVTDEQQRWLSLLAALGYDVGVWRPSDLLNGRIAVELTAVRSAASALTGTVEG
jgi:hypothetical protein